MHGTLIKLSGKLIICSDIRQEEIKEKDIIYNELSGIGKCIYNDTSEIQDFVVKYEKDTFEVEEDFKHCKQVIAQSPDIILSKEFAEEIGWVDVEELNTNEFRCRHHGYRIQICPSPPRLDLIDSNMVPTTDAASGKI